MNKNIRLQFVLIVFFMLFSSLISLSAASYEEIYQKYIQSYKNYQQAVSKKLSKAEIDKAISEYRTSKAAYDLAVHGKTSEFDTNPAEYSSFAEYNNQNVSADYEVVTAGRSDSQRSTASFTASLPDNLRLMAETLKTTKSKAQAVAIINAFEKFAEANPQSAHVDVLKYEMASALDRLNIDAKKAATLFEQVSQTTQNQQLKSWSRLNLNYLKGKQYKAQWQNVMQNKFNEMTSAFNKYKSTSWLAFPVKATRGTAYLAKSVSYINTQNKHEDFLLWFEAAQAPFVTNVIDVFEQYQKEQLAEKAEENARIRLIYSNYESWYARWKIMSEARTSIDAQYFIIEDDVFGVSLLGMLLKKAREGVKIRLMVDVRGSNKLSLKVMAKGFLEELAKLPNVQVKVYNPLQANLLGAFTDIRRIISSNHDKIMIADGRYSIIGGRNIADEYLVDPIDEPKAWRDTDVLIDSENVTAQLQKAFEDEFEILKAFEVGRSLLGMTGYRLLQMEIGYLAMESALNKRGPLQITKKFSTQSALVKKFNEQLAKYTHMTGYHEFDLAEKSHVCPVQILDSHSLSGPRNDITENIVKYIDGSRREVILQNPYVVFTPRAEAALKRASRRGIPILVHTNSPQTSDSFPTEAMLYRDWRSILKDMPTMRIFATVNEGQLHGKNFVFDGRIGVVGTYNLDFLSEKVNSEVVAVVKSNGFANELRKEIVFDIKKAVEYTLATADRAEFGPGDVENPQKMWLIKLISKMGWLKPLF